MVLRLSDDFLNLCLYRIAGVLNTSDASRVLDIFRFLRVSNMIVFFFHKLKFYITFDQVLCLFSSGHNKKEIVVVLEEKTSQESPINASVSQSSVSIPALLLWSVIFLVLASLTLLPTIVAVMSTLYFVRYLLRQEPELAAEVKTMS